LDPTAAEHAKTSYIAVVMDPTAAEHAKTSYIAFVIFLKHVRNRTLVKLKSSQNCESQPQRVT
jgi:hypothetical protein